MWIYRDISKKLSQNHEPIQIIRGPRQCGKSSLLHHLDPTFKEISLDDPALRQLAENDPELFVKQFTSEKLFIDEVQYAPALFPSLKKFIDLYKRSKEKKETIIRLTGSNQILMDKFVKESLVGRASFYDLNTLSVAEILSAKTSKIQDIIYTGGWPELHADETKIAKKYLDDYINSYIEKDIVLAAGIQKSREFLKFVRLLAGRVGQILDFASLGRDAGVDAKTSKDWISILEKMQIIYLVMPFFSNLSSRLIKSPKVFFIDTGLACRLQGWTSAEPILTSPQQGSLFENLVFSEILKTNRNFELGFEIFHWRSRAGEEIDFVIQQDPQNYIFLESKVSPTKPKAIANFPEFKKVFAKKNYQSVVCHQEGERILNNQIPIAHLRDFLLSC